MFVSEVVMHVDGMVCLMVNDETIPRAAGRRSRAKDLVELKIFGAQLGFNGGSPGLMNGACSGEANALVLDFTILGPSQE